MKNVKIDKIDVATTLVMVFFLYLAVSGIVFAFRHPELTQIQRLIHIWDVVTWQKLDI